MNPRGRFSKSFFVVGLATACVLMLLPLLFDSLRSSVAFALASVIFFPISILSAFMANGAPGVRVLSGLLAVFLNGAAFGLLGALFDWVLPIFDGRPVHPVPISDLPLWRRLIVISALVVFGLTLAANIGSDFKISGFRPIQPDPATGQVYLVHVNHGAARYVTLEEKESLEFWRNSVFECTGPLFMTAFFLWITVPPPKAGTVR